MLLPSPFHKALLKDRATFKTTDAIVSQDGVAWSHVATLSVAADGCIYATDLAARHAVLLPELPACHVQIFSSPSVAALAQKRRFSKGKEQDALVQPDEPPVVFIRTFNNARLYVKVGLRLRFGNLLLTLLAWQNMRPQGLAKKWFAQNKAHSPALDPHELLVCRFKLYGPLPAKSRSVNVVLGPRVPVCFDEFDLAGHSSPQLAAGHDSHVPEGWFYTMGVLKSNGMLNFITELDGTLLYSVDMRTVFSLEIREIHHSICNSPNTLFVGRINELRLNNVIKSTSAALPDSIAAQHLLWKDGRPVANNGRILIEFPLHIDLEDWYVGLNYFCKREYIGVYNRRSVLNQAPSTRVVDLEGTLETPSISENGLDDSRPAPDLSSFLRDHLRVLKKVSLDIIEAKFENHTASDKALGKIYAEVVMWGFPWARTSIVSHTQNPFWKEEFSTDLPISTQMIRIAIKKCNDDKTYSPMDKVIGTVYVTPDILTQRMANLSTMMTESETGQEISVPGVLNTVGNAPSLQGNNIVRLSIYDSANLPVGKLLVTVELKEYLIPPPMEFRTLEHMLLSCPMKQLIEHCNNTVGTQEFESVSYVLLDIFQSLGIEDQWFKTLIEVELISVDNMTRKNYVRRSLNNTLSNNVFNTLFRGSSIFTKSLEKYIFRIGQEYLEKVFGNFFEKISSERKNCEIDPRYVRLQLRAKKKGRSFYSADNGNVDSDDDESDDSYDSEEEHKEEEMVKQIVQENFENLYAYSEDIWLKIYTTSNDLPQQIKDQLKNFRTKVDLACDPQDKSTSLNCLSAFIFLRFFCPAILNPKLFYLTKDHQTGHAQRTLTVIAKILLNLANRQEFSPHKESHLVAMNGFLKKHENEVYDYFDKITGRKNDFNEKILNLSHEMKRFDLGLSEDSVSNELPTTPYLIDKYLRLTEFVHLLQFNGTQSRSLRLAPSVSSTSVATTMSLSPSLNGNGASTIPSRRNTQHERGLSLDGADEIQLNNERNVYQIGSLEFEKSEFLDLVGDNETEGFIKSLCRSNEEIFSFITSNITIKDLQKQSTNIVKKINDLALQLQTPELCLALQHDAKLWEAFVNDVVDRAYLETTKNSLVYYDPNFQDGPLHGQKRLIDNALSGLKLKFTTENQGSLVKSFSSTSIGGLVKSGGKNPFKRWLKRD